MEQKRSMSTQPTLPPFKPRMTVPPPEDGELAVRLQNLVKRGHHWSAAQWQNEVKQLIPLAEKLKRQRTDYFTYGMLSGIAAGVIAAALLMA